MFVFLQEKLLTCFCQELRGPGHLGSIWPNFRISSFGAPDHLRPFWNPRKGCFVSDPFSLLGCSLSVPHRWPQRLHCSTAFPGPLPLSITGLQFWLPTRTHTRCGAITSTTQLLGPCSGLENAPPERKLIPMPGSCFWIPVFSQILAKWFLIILSVLTFWKIFKYFVQLF